MADLMAQERACDRTSDNSKQRDLFPKARAIENGGLFMQTGAMERGGFKKGETKQTDLFPKACARESGADLFAEARARAGAAVQLLFCPCGHAGEALSALLPYGKAALVIDEAVPPPAPSSAETLRSCFRWQTISAPPSASARAALRGRAFLPPYAAPFPFSSPPIRRRKGCLRRSPRPRGRAIRSPLPT